MCNAAVAFLQDFTHDRYMEPLYFDHAATSPMTPDALMAYQKAALSFPANPSSSHQAGKRAKDELERIRGEFATLLCAQREQVVFTSGGTESNSMVIEHFLHSNKSGNHCIISGIEHPSIHEYAAPLRSLGMHVTIIDAPGGMVLPEQIIAAVRDQTVLVCLMSVNNVTGVIQPLKKLRADLDELVSQGHRPIHLHSDAVQAFGKLPSDRFIPYVDSASISAHKVGGPKGFGLLYLSRPITRISPGGGQESGLRPGTEDLPAAAAALTASRKAFETLKESFEHVTGLQERLSDTLQSNGLFTILFVECPRSPYILSISNEYVPSEVLMRVLSDHQCYISTGSACSSKSRAKLQRVLVSSDVPEPLRDGALRISFTGESTEEDVDSLARCMIEQTEPLVRALARRPQNRRKR